MSTQAPFSGIEPVHFAAYDEHKWKKGSFNRERTAVHETVLSLVHDVRARLSERLAALDIGVTSDHPSVLNNWQVDAKIVFLGRAAEEKTRLRHLLARERIQSGRGGDPQPHQVEASLAVVVDAAGVEVGIRLPGAAALDRRNVAEWLRAENVDTFASLLQALPDDVTVTLGSEVRVAASVDAAWVQALPARLEGTDALSIGTAFGRSEERTKGPGFVDHVARLVEALLPVFRTAQWRDDHDFVGGAAALAEPPETETAAPDAPAQTQGAEGEVSAEEHARRGGYRPDWAPTGAEPRGPTRAPQGERRPEGRGEGRRQAAEARPGPSARVRERAAEVSKEAEAWTYSGPVRPRPAPPPEPPRRDDRGPPRENHDRPHRGPGDGPPGRQDGPGRRDDRGPPGGDRGHPGGDRGRPPGDRRPPGNDQGAPGGDRGGPRRDDRGPGGPPRRDDRGPGQRPGPGGPPGSGDRPGGRGPDRDQGRRDDRRGGPDGGRGDRPGDRPPQGGPDRRQDGGPRNDDRQGDRRPDDRGRGRDQGQDRRQEAPRPRPEPQWEDAAGELAKLDHVRVGTGMFSGKVGKIIDVVGKGKVKVALGDGGVTMDFPREALTRVVVMASTSEI